MLSTTFTILSHLVAFLMALSWIESQLYPLLLYISILFATRLNYWATSIVLWAPTTLGLCCARLIVSPSPRKTKTTAADYVVKRSRLLSPPRDTFHRVCDAAYGLSYNAFVADIEVGLELVNNKTNSPYLMSSRPIPRPILLAPNESTLAVSGSLLSEFTARTVYDDKVRTKSVDVGAEAQDIFVYTSQVVQTLSGTDSTMAIFGSDVDEDTGPTAVGDDIAAENESIMAVFGSAVEWIWDEDGDGGSGSAAVSRASRHLRASFRDSFGLRPLGKDARLSHSSAPSLDCPDRPSVRCSDPRHKGKAAPGFGIPPSHSAFLDKYFGTESSMEFEAFLQTVAVPEVNEELEILSRNIQSESTSTIEAAATTIPRLLPLDEANTSCGSSKSNDLSELEDDDEYVNWSHELSYLFSAEVCEKFDRDMAELLAELDRDEGEVL